MDCAPLFVVNAEDLTSALWRVSLFAVLAGVAGAAVWQAVGELPRVVYRAWRVRRCAAPFAVRVDRVRAARERTFLLLDRVCQRQARELARQGVLDGR